MESATWGIVRAQKPAIQDELVIFQDVSRRDFSFSQAAPSSTQLFLGVRLGASGSRSYLAWDLPLIRGGLGWMGNRRSEWREAMQRLMVFGHNIDVTRELRGYIDSQVEGALRPFGKRVGTVCVRLHQATDPGAQVSCYIRVDLNPSGGLALGEFAPETKQAIALATRRIGAAVGREIGRAQGAANSTERSHAFLT